MGSPDQLALFIASSFRSVWALELLLLLKQEGRSCTTEELVSMMYASPSVIENALDSLTAAGLSAREGATARYMAASPEAAAMVEETEQLYRARPDRVRRLIIASSHRNLAAFSDAFRLKD